MVKVRIEVLNGNKSNVWEGGIKTSKFFRGLPVSTLRV